MHMTVLIFIKGPVHAFNVATGLALILGRPGIVRTQ